MIEPCGDKEDRHSEDERRGEEGDVPRGEDPRGAQPPQHHPLQGGLQNQKRAAMHCHGLR